jgi:ABC-2 type transport system ATP-binding protein
MKMYAIKIENLTKKFNDFTAVDNISFVVESGELFGLLGPNGAGKTTTEAKQLMGIVPEMANAYVDLSAIKNLLLIGELYGIEKKERIGKAESLLRLFGLYEKRQQKVKTFSKGMQQRLIVAMGLMNDPELLFLDEPTSGLDVESVRLIRELIRKFNDNGTTIVLTTHNIEEANQLCDRVAIMDHGKIVAIDRPEKLKHTIQSTSSIEVAFDKKVKTEELMLDGVIEVKKAGDKLRLYTENPEDVIPMVVQYSQSSGNKIISLNTLAPNLEDVFLKLTKRGEK